MQPTTHRREYREGRTGRRRTYLCRKCGEKFQVEAEPTQQVEQTPTQKTIAWSHLPNVGALLNRARNYNMKRSDVFAALNVMEASDIPDADDSWLKIASDKGFTPSSE